VVMTALRGLYVEKGEDAARSVVAQVFVEMTRTSSPALKYAQPHIRDGYFTEM
jgi:hypothetical protein